MKKFKSKSGIGYVERRELDGQLAPLIWNNPHRDTIRVRWTVRQITKKARKK